MQRTTRQPNWRPLLWAGAAGLLLYLIFQLVPEVIRATGDSGYGHYIAKTEAEAAAVRFAEEHFGGAFEPAAVVHQIRTELYGYLSRDDLGEDYDERFSRQYPVETWQVELHGDGDAILYVHVHMSKGEVVAWNKVSGGGREMEFGAASLAARAFAIERGYAERELRLRGLPEDGAIVFDVEGRRVGEANLTLRIGVRQDGDGTIRVTAFRPEFELPDEYTDYVARQDMISSILTFAGYIGLSFVMFVIAVIYAALMRGWTSFARGLLLSGIFLVFYQINNINMFDGVRASAGEVANAGSMTMVLTVLQVLFTFGIAVSVWFAFVGGDGLWRSMGYNLWMRRGERGFGADVWQAVKIGYCAAFALLGLQAVIFLVMEQGFGIWASADVTQSTLNFRWVLLFPLLAWCAAISEEAMYRLFGVGLFRKWFRNTAAACVIPTVVWALGHVAYPIYPWSTRLIELTILGLLFCWLFVRYGFAAALFAHAVFDLVLMATSLMFLGGADAMLAGIFYILHPIGIAWLIHWWDRRRPPKTAAAPVAMASGALAGSAPADGESGDGMSAVGTSAAGVPTVGASADGVRASSGQTPVEQAPPGAHALSGQTPADQEHGDMAPDGQTREAPDSSAPSSSAPNSGEPDRT